MDAAEHAYMLELSNEFFEKTKEAIRTNGTEVVVFLKKKLSSHARHLLRQYGITVQHSRKLYNDNGVVFEYWTEAIVMR